MNKTKQLRKMIQSGQTEFIMEAHNGLSAKIIEETGFKGIWASGLTLSASLGVRDNNEASWTQVLEVLEFMSDGTNIPILLDGDTGYGNFNNMRRLVRKLEQREIAGVCIEDKLFPKTNSFIRGESQPLADMDEFCGKIKAAKDSQLDEDFNVVARVEAFIAGWGLSEALRRADAYREAGADAILIHSKKSDSSDIEAFMKEWGDRHPIVIVPTKYYSTPTDFLRELGISLIIWANHSLRSSVTAIQNTVKRIYDDESLINVEDNIASVAELFRLQGAQELEEAEKRYLPTTGKNVNAIILAAAQGSRFGDLTESMPKALLPVNGKPILTTLIDEFNHVGIKDIAVVRGYKKDEIKLNNIKAVDNDEYADTTELYSLNLAADMIQENTVICYGDIVVKSYVLNDLLNDNNDITVIVDADYETNDDYHDYVKTSEPYSRKHFNQVVQLKKMSSELEKDQVDGEFIGLIKVNKAGAEIIKETLKQLSELGDFRQLRMADLLTEVASKHPVAVKYIKGSWLDIDSIVDLHKASEL